MNIIKKMIREEVKSTLRDMATLRTIREGNKLLEKATETILWKDTKKYKIQKPPRKFAEKAKVGAMIHFTGPKSGAKGETWEKWTPLSWKATFGEGVKGDALSNSELDKKLESHGRVQIKEGKLTEALARGLKPLLVLGSKITKKVGEKVLVKLSDKFDRIDDEQADDVASHLNMAIELMQDGSPSEARAWLKKFNTACKDALSGKSIKSAFEGVKLSESGILYKAGVKKYGKDGMAKILKLAGEKGPDMNAKIGKIKDQHEGKLSESRGKKVTKQMWNKMSEDERMDALLTIIQDPDAAEKYVDKKWDQLNRLPLMYIS